MRGGSNHAEREIFGPRMEVQGVGGVQECVYTLNVCMFALLPRVTSGVIFLASRRDSEIIRNVNTHRSLYIYEFSVSFFLSLSLSMSHLLFLEFLFHKHTYTLSNSIISLSPYYE